MILNYLLRKLNSGNTFSFPANDGSGSSLVVSQWQSVTLGGVYLGCIGSVPISTNVFPISGGDPINGSPRSGSLTLGCTSGSGSIVYNTPSAGVYNVTFRHPNFCCPAGCSGPGGSSGPYCAAADGSYCCPPGERCRTCFLLLFLFCIITLVFDACAFYVGKLTPY